MPVSGDGEREAWKVENVTMQPNEKAPGIPIAFVSHASEDKSSFAEPLSRKLAELGVQPWLDKWEIRPGDSLVQRLFDEGLKNADAVILVTSPVSVSKRWVREELDSATVGRIERGTKLIPIRLDGVEMPEPLRHLRWLNADRTPESVEQIAGEIADLLHGATQRPAIGARPGYIDQAAFIPGMTPADTFLLCETIREAIKSGHLIVLDWATVEAKAKQAGLTGKKLMESLHALAEGDYVDVDLRGDHVVHYNLTDYGYASGIEAVIPDLAEVHRRIVALLVNDPPTGDQIIHDLAARGGTERLVVDQLLTDLEARGLLGVTRTLGDHSRLHQVSPTLGRLLT
jgi:hypothetical protein